MAQRFLDVDRATPYLLPPSVDEWIEAKHLARFVVEVGSAGPVGRRRTIQWAELCKRF